MSFDANVWEMGEYFAGPPATYKLLLPSKLQMKLTARRAVRAKRKKPQVSITLQLRRPLNEESCYQSITKMHPEDHADVLTKLEGYFKPKGLTVGGLTLKFLKQVRPTRDFAEPYDLVEATFVVE